MAKKILCSACGCENPATHSTITLGEYVCDNTDCLVELAMDNYVDEELTEDDHEDYGEEID